MRYLQPRSLHTFGPMGWEAEQLQPTRPEFRSAKLPRRRSRDRTGQVHPADPDQPRQQREQLRACPLRQPAVLADRAGPAGPGPHRPGPHGRGRRPRGGVGRRVGRAARQRRSSLGLDQGPAREAHEGSDGENGLTPPERRNSLERGGYSGPGKDPDHVLEVRQRDAEQLSTAKLPAIPGIPDATKARGRGGPGRSEVGGRRPRSPLGGQKSRRFRPGRGAVGPGGWIRPCCVTPG